MKIILSPVASDKTTEIIINESIVIIDNLSYDLSVIPEDGQAEADEDSPFIGIVTRDKCTIRYEYNSTLAEPDQSKNLDDYTFDVTNGEVPCPIIWKPVEEEAFV